MTVGQLHKRPWPPLGHAILFEVHCLLLGHRFKAVDLPLLFALGKHHMMDPSVVAYKPSSAHSNWPTISGMRISRSLGRRGSASLICCQKLCWMLQNENRSWLRNREISLLAEEGGQSRSLYGLLVVRVRKGLAEVSWPVESLRRIQVASCACRWRRVYPRVSRSES